MPTDVDDLRGREVKAWLTELRHATARHDRDATKRIRTHLRRLGHTGGLRDATSRESKRATTRGPKRSTFGDRGGSFRGD
jgi:hypothetical protein